MLTHDCSRLVGSVAEDLFAHTFARFYDRVHGPERFIASELGISGYLAVATVATRARAAGRLAISPEQVPDFLEAAKELGVPCRVGRARMLSLPDAIPETRHAAAFVTDNRPTAMSLVYFGVTSTLAAGAEQAELHGDHDLLAQLFGYPACCAEFYASSASAGADRVPASINSLGPFDRLLNPVTTYVYDLPSLLFHFPCSPSCAASIFLAKQRIRWLSQIDPSVGAIENVGAGLALYGPEVGLGLATQYETEGTSMFRLHKIITRSCITLGLFGGRAQAIIRFDAPGAFEIGGRRFCRPDQFGAIFI